MVNSEEPEEQMSDRTPSERVQLTISRDLVGKIDKIHEVLTGDEYGNEGLISSVQKNTSFRHKREEERRVQVRFGKIGGFIIGSGGVSWLAFKEKIIAIWHAIIN